ncbi:MAG: outer membrane lipoprotein carrier protein LolA [Alphaproteobacteria bacterium]|nr:outer membrane lipoprotein carrier protein LolA [Alphaproteobacteria bacterium]
MKRIFSTVLIMFFCLNSSPTQAQKAQDLYAIENYLNSIKNMEADFVQTSSNGGTAEGKIYIAKPNKIRMEYADPTSVLIVGDGNYIVFHDKELDQITHIDYDDIPASLILANNIKIDGKNIKATDFYQDAGMTSITLDYKEKGDIGPITLTFSNNPLELKQWKIIDPQNIEVKVSLYNITQDTEMKDSLFKFKDKKANPLNYKKKR